MEKNRRLFFVDNIRVLLTILVIAFHLMITYAGTGSWYYNEGREDFITGALGAWFLTVNQAYFMGLFLLISAYFVPGSYDRKGAGKFLLDRLVRLGIPLALYSWVIRPVLGYLDPLRFAGARPPFWSYLTELYFKNESVLGSGPLWFIEVLLIFSLLYVIWRLATKNRPIQPVKDARFPGSAAIVLFALLMGLAAFVVRIWLPAGWNWKLLNLQFPFFVQYIAMYIVGLVTYRRNWFLTLPDRTGRLWLWIGVAFIILFWPLVLGGGAIENGLDAFRGGLHWQSLAYALWESFLCLGMCLGLIYLFRRRADHQGKLGGFLARNAYTAYLIHEVVIIAFAYAVRGVMVYPLLKWALVSLVAVPLCFLLSSFIRKIPYADRVLG